MKSGDVLCVCTDGRTAKSCLTCDNYCLNGGICSISRYTEMPDCQCPSDRTGPTCEEFVGQSQPTSKTTSVVIPIVVILLLLLLGIGIFAWYRHRMSGAKGFQHQRMTNGAMNVEIGNPTYKMYEGEPDDDVGELIDADFTLDPDKPTNFTNPVYATLYMGAHNSRNSLASTDEKRELLSRGGEDDFSDPLA